MPCYRRDNSIWTLQYRFTGRTTPSVELCELQEEGQLYRCHDILPCYTRKEGNSTRYSVVVEDNTICRRTAPSVRYSVLLQEGGQLHLCVTMLCYRKEDRSICVLQCSVTGRRTGPSVCYSALLQDRGQVHLCFAVPCYEKNNLICPLQCRAVGRRTTLFMRCCTCL